MISAALLGTVMVLGQTPIPAFPNPLPNPGIRATLGLPVVVADAPKAKNPGGKQPAPDPKDNGNGNGNGDKEKEVYGPLKTFFRGYPANREWFPHCFGKPDVVDPNAPEEPPAPRRGFPAPFAAPPFPTSEWQATPVPGQPLTTDNYPLTEALYAIQAGGVGDWLKDHRIRVYGWINASTNWTNNKDNNAPDSYWLRANKIELDQFVVKIEREVDSVQTDHIDVGFRSCILYGQDYRYTIAGGWGANQLFRNNNLYGWDPIEQYIDVYVPYIAQGVIFRVGRWVACPDIETQLAPDNYLGTHSILFTFDTYTQTGVEASIKLSDQWLVQFGINCGNDMAPWYRGATVSGFAAARWISCDNKDSIYTALNQINNAQFRHFEMDGQPAGHDNYNYIVSTWQYAFSDKCLNKIEGYYMWQYNAELGGTPSLGPVEPWGGGGGDGQLLRGLSRTYGMVDYFCYALGKNDFVTVRNEWWHDERGMRSGFPGLYTSNTIGLTHYLSKNLLVRPECGYYRNWNNPAFDNGARKDCVIAGCDLILRF